MWRGNGKGYVSLSNSDVIQMMGRAGRPGYDTNGIAIVMTSNNDHDRYQNVSINSDVVESCLLDIVVESICTEITQGMPFSSSPPLVTL